MRRREFLTSLAMLALAPPTQAAAQRSDTVRRIAIIMGFPDSDAIAQGYVSAFRQRLASLGWVDDRNIRIEERWASGDPEKARSFARQLIALEPSVIVTSTNQVTEAVRRETQSIPIVFASLGDPVGSGLVASLNRPGGNVTGFPTIVGDMGGKWLELLAEIAPQVKRVGFVFHPAAVPHIGLLRAAEFAAPSLHLKLSPIPVRTADEISAGIEAFASDPNGGLVAATHAITYSHRDLLAGLAVRHRLPTVFGDIVFAQSGGLASYGADLPELFRGAASYVDLILRGAKPADLPVQLPTKFNLVINQRTARALGLEVPPTLLARADEVIE